MWLIYSFLSDAGCLVFGKLFGKTALQKQISPGKTMEGTLGGFLFTILFSILISQIKSPIMPDIQTQDYIISAFFISVFSSSGDLIESFLKRAS